MIRYKQLLNMRLSCFVCVCMLYMFHDARYYFLLYQFFFKYGEEIKKQQQSNQSFELDLIDMVELIFI